MRHQSLKEVANKLGVPVSGAIVKAAIRRLREAGYGLTVVVPNPTTPSKTEWACVDATPGVIKQALTIRGHNVKLPQRQLPEAPPKPRVEPPLAVPKPTNGDLDDTMLMLKRAVTTLNIVVLQLEQERVVSKNLREELARLSVTARRAMVVYGD